MKEFIKKHKGIITSILITIGIMLILYAANGIYPFGDKIFGLKDFDHAYTPVYYKLWDVLHGVSSPLFDWNLGAGLNCFGSLIMNSLFFPTTLIVCLVPRSFIPNMMGIIIILKLVTITCTTYYTLNKLFNKTNDLYKVLFTLLYTFSGWMLYMISNLLYLDVIAIFPLFILAYYRLLKENKWVMYYITLTLCLLSSYYMSWMILFFLFGCTPLALLFLDIKDKKKKAVTIFILTIASLLSSAVLFLPSFYQSMTSTRMTDDTGTPYYSVGVLLLKITYLFPMATAIFYTIKQLLNKKDKKTNIFYILLLIYLLIGIILEPINRMWHTGSYSGMPFRYSYIPCFILILIAMHYLSNIKEKSSKLAKNDYINSIASLITLSIFILLAILFRKEMKFDYIFEITKYSQFFGLLLLFIISITTTLLINKINIKIKPILLIILFLTTTLTYYLYFFESGEQTSLQDQKLKDNLNLKNDYYNYADYTASLSINYPYILQVPSNENRIHIINKEIKDMYDYLGYYYFDTFLYSYGGTIFSDMLLHNKYIFTKEELNDKLYTKIDSYNDINYYETIYNADYLIPYNGAIYNEENYNIYDIQNDIYQKLFAKEDNLLEKVSLNENKLSLEKDYIYYISYTCLDLCPTIQFPSSVIIQKQYQKNTYNYEIFTNEDTSITLDNKEYPELDVRRINVNKYIDFVNSINNHNTSVEIDKNKKIYTYKAAEDTSLLIPVNYDTSFKISINDEEVSYTKNVYNMISIDVKKGSNTIVLKYIPKFKKEGLLISIITIAIVIFVSLLNKKFNILDKKFILYPLFVLSCLITIFFFLKVYVLSLF